MGRKQPERILILEDDNGLRNALCEVLTDEGFEVVAAERALEAVARAESEGFDLIVADIRMSGMDGLEAVEAVRQTQPRIRTVVMTGYSSEADSVRALQLGIHDYLRKPFEIEQFLDAVQRQIRLRREELQVFAREKAARRVVLWALETQIPESEAAALGMCRLAHQVCLNLGLSDPEAEEVQILALAEFLRGKGVPLEAAPLREGLTTEFREWLNQLDDAEDLPLGVRVALGALHRLGGKGAPPDSDVEQAFEQAARGDAVSRSAASVTRRRRGLLTLAQALEETDKLEAARLYEEIAREKSPTVEVVSACLALARLRPRAQLAALLPATLAMARQVGPSAYAHTALTLGLLVGGAEGVGMVGSARQVLAQLPESNAQARAQLALDYLEERAPNPAMLGQLTQDASHAEWHACSAWLTPYLLRCQAREPKPEQAAALSRLLRTPAAANLLSIGSTSERLLLLGLLRGQRVPALDALLRQIESHDPDTQVARAAGAALHSEAPSLSTVLKVYTLGPVEVAVGDQLVPASAWTNRKQVTLLAFLASHSTPQTEDVIIDHLWPDKDLTKGRNNINAALSNIRRVLKNLGNELDYFKRDRRGIWLDSELPFWHDLNEFSRCLQAADERGAPPERVQELLRRACALYRGPFLEGTYLEWAEPFRQREEFRLTEALLRLCELCLAREQFLEVVEHSQRLLEMDPCCQPACHFNMKAYLGMKRAEEAVRSFERCRKALRNDLAMEPAISLLELHQRALL